MSEVSIFTGLGMVGNQMFKPSNSSLCLSFPLLLLDPFPFDGAVSLAAEQ
jgi:hypothetical protein